MPRSGARSRGKRGTQLDRALRQLAATLEATGPAMPLLAGVTLARATTTLTLGEAADPPSPWEVPREGMNGGRERVTNLGHDKYE